MFTGKEGTTAVVIVLAAFFLGACTGNRLIVEPIATSQSPQGQVNRLAEDVDNARSGQVNVLAPTWFAKAERSLKKAKGLLDRGEEDAAILERIAYGRAQLLRASEAAQLARTTLGDAIDARDLARTAGATGLEDYGEVEGRFLGLTRAIEENDVQWAQRRRTKVIEGFRDLELRAIKEGALGEVHRLVGQAEQGGAKDVAPQTLAVAKERLREVDRYISEHRYEKAEIQTKAAEALFQARRLHQVARQTAEVRRMGPEQITLWVEGLLYQAASRLSAPEVRDQDVDTQVENILCSITALQKDVQSLSEGVKAKQAEIDALRSHQQEQAVAMKEQIISLEGRSREELAVRERLAAETRFHQLFNEVRGYFEPNEAEVYKQGNQLVIRLRAIHFPVGEYVILPSNYPLLSKVQRAIRAFGDPDLLVEGHTDSTGSSAVNAQLSQQRAEAVREYLVANGTAAADRVVAAGYGSSRPLAPNETAEGRAINRRIDLVITPRPQSGQ